MKKTKTCGERRKEERKKQGNKEGNKQAMFNGFVWNPDTNNIANKQTQNPENSDQKKKNKQTNTQTHEANYYNYFIATGRPKSKKMDKQNNT
jgi:hypothetical protein